MVANTHGGYANVVTGNFPVQTPFFQPSDSGMSDSGIANPKGFRYESLLRVHAFDNSTLVDHAEIVIGVG